MEMHTQHFCKGIAFYDRGDRIQQLIKQKQIEFEKAIEALYQSDKIYA